jgi:hypothetical protein
MAANMPMVGNGQLMMQQQQQPQQQQQQHLRQSTTQMHAAVYQALLATQSAVPQGGWQSTVPVQDRLTKIMTL